MNTLNTNIYLLPDNYETLKLNDLNIIKTVDYLEIGTNCWDSWCHEKPYLKGIVVEPLKIYLDKLISDSRCIKNNLIIENCCISDTNGEDFMYFIPPEVIDNKNIVNCLKGMNKLGNFHNGHMSYMKDVVKEKCITITFHNLLQKHNLNYVDYLKIDTEGHEITIINNILKNDNKLFILPRFILFENNACSDKNEMQLLIYNLIKTGYEHIFTENDNTYMYYCKSIFDISKQINNIILEQDTIKTNKKIFIYNVHQHYVEIAFKELFRKYNFNLIDNPDNADIIITTQDINDIKLCINKYPNKKIISQIHGGGIGSIKLLYNNFPHIPVICKSFDDYIFFKNKGTHVVLSIGKYEKYSDFFKKIYEHRVYNLYKDLSKNNFLILSSSWYHAPKNLLNAYLDLKDKWNIDSYGPDSNLGYIDVLQDNTLFIKYKFYLHLKNIGYLCNSVIMALMSGIPIIMNRENYEKTLYSQFIPKEIIIFIENYHSSNMTKNEIIDSLNKAISLNNTQYLELSHKTYLAGSFFRQYYQNELEEMNYFLNNL